MIIINETPKKPTIAIGLRKRIPKTTTLTAKIIVVQIRSTHVPFWASPLVLYKCCRLKFIETITMVQYRKPTKFNHTLMSSASKYSQTRKITITKALNSFEKFAVNTLTNLIPFPHHLNYYIHLKVFPIQQQLP